MASIFFNSSSWLVRSCSRCMLQVWVSGSCSCGQEEHTRLSEGSGLIGAAAFHLSLAVINAVACLLRSKTCRLQSKAPRNSRDRVTRSLGRSSHLCLVLLFISRLLMLRLCPTRTSCLAAGRVLAIVLLVQGTALAFVLRRQPAHSKTICVAKVVQWSKEGLEHEDARH